MKFSPESEYISELKGAEQRLLGELREVRQLLRQAQTKPAIVRIGIEHEDGEPIFFKVNRMPRPSNVVDIRPTGLDPNNDSAYNL